MAMSMSRWYARAAEDKFIADGHGINRRDVMYNDFILVGPASDPDEIKDSRDVLAALKKIQHDKAKFISRGDNSGTHQMAESYWKAIGSKSDAGHLISAGPGMGEVLNMAAELNAYTLTDRATYVAYRAKTGLAIMVEGDPGMFNPYGIIAVNPARYKDINYKGAMQLINWITSDQGQKKIASFKLEGQQLFFPSATR